MSACCASHLVVEVRVVQQRLGGDAADVEAGAAQRAALLHARHLHAQLCRFDGAHVAARPATHHHQVVHVIRRGRAEHARALHPCLRSEKPQRRR